HHARRAGARHAAVRRGAHRAGVHHSRLRQAHRRCRVQPRLRGGAGCGAVHGDCLHRAEPARRHRVLPRQSAFEGSLMATLAANALPSEITPGRRALRRLAKRRAAIFGLGVVALFIAIAIAAPWLAPYDPLATSWAAVRKAPSAAHWFGTDEIGRDVLSRV